MRKVGPARMRRGLICHQEFKMPTIDIKEKEILTAFEMGQLKSVATKSDLAKFKAAASATAIKDRRVNIQLSEQPSSVKSRSSSAAKRGSS